MFLGLDYKNMNIDNLSINEKIASGVEADVYNATSMQRGNCIVKVFKKKVFKNKNDGEIKAMDIALKEKKIIEGITSELVNEISFYDIIESPSLICSVMPYLGGEIPNSHLSKCYNYLENLWNNSSNFKLSNNGSSYCDTQNKMIDDIYFRLTNMLNDANYSANISKQSLRNRIINDTSPIGLLHMDFRPSNILLKDNVYSLIDWTNALIYNIDLEKARILELVETPERLKQKIQTTTDVETNHFLIYRLYTSSMLANLFKNTLNNKSRHSEYLNRSLSILDKLGLDYTLNQS